ncbi:MAG TPA: hypothetical protein VMU07_01010 [Candidatus Paceibacterota bacterium]|nr:hypothetical protein [Candidatus Paceibacterota bacterium]
MLEKKRIEIRQDLIRWASENLRLEPDEEIHLILYIKKKTSVITQDDLLTKLLGMPAEAYFTEDRIRSAGAKRLVVNRLKNCVLNASSASRSVLTVRDVVKLGKKGFLKTKNAGKHTVDAMAMVLAKDGITFPD